MAKTEDKIAKGYIHFNAILEIVGKPKDHVEATFADYIAQIKKSPKFEIISERVEEVIAVEGSENLFSTFAELGVLVKNMGALFDFCFECMPASIEVLAPQNITLRGNEISGAVNDLIGRIHHLDISSKQVTQQNTVLTQSLRVALENAIVLYLAQAPRSLEDISHAVGMDTEQLSALLGQMVTGGKITSVTDGVYALPGRPVVKTNGEGKNTSVISSSSDSSDEIIKIKKKPK